MSASRTARPIASAVRDLAPQTQIIGGGVPRRWQAEYGDQRRYPERMDSDPRTNYCQHDPQLSAELPQYLYNNPNPLREASVDSYAQNLLYPQQTDAPCAM